jgi:hypothetical protein
MGFNKKPPICRCGVRFDPSLDCTSPPMGGSVKIQLLMDGFLALVNKFCSHAQAQWMVPTTLTHPLAVNLADVHLPCCCCPHCRYSGDCSIGVPSIGTLTVVQPSAVSTHFAVVVDLFACPRMPTFYPLSRRHFGSSNAPSDQYGLKPIRMSRYLMTDSQFLLG